MRKLRSSASAAGLILGLLCAPAAVRAEDAPPAQPSFPGVPLDLSPPPPVEVRAPSRMRWYGWQILTPTLASDTIALAGFFSGQGGTLISQPGQPAAGWAVFAVGLIGRGVSGPIVHLAHHHPAKALASLALEAALPAAALGATFASFGAGGGGDDDFPNLLPFFLAISLLPVAFSAGTAIDSAALAWEDRPPPSRPAQAVTWSVAPLALPALRAGAAHPGPVPMGAGLVGTF